jgi:hypothetical protein
MIPIEKLIMYLARQLTEEKVERKISDLDLVFEKAENWEEKAEKAYLLDYEKKILHQEEEKRKIGFDLTKNLLNKIISKIKGL